MAIDFSSFDNPVDEPRELDFSSFDNPVDEPRELDFSAFDSEEPEDPTTGEVVAGVGTEIASSVGGSVLGGIIGGTLGAGFFGIGAAPGAVIGSAIGGFAGGFFGSMFAQDIEDQPDFSLGRALGAGVVSAIPLGGAAVKGLRGGAKITGSMVAGAAARE